MRFKTISCGFGRLFEHGVQRNDQGQVDVADQLEDVRSGLAAEDAIFVLEPDCLRAARLNPRSCFAITGGFVDGDGPDIRRIIDRPYQSSIA